MSFWRVLVWEVCVYGEVGGEDNMEVWWEDEIEFGFDLGEFGVGEIWLDLDV